MSSADSTPVLLARGIGTLGAGLTTGFMLSYPAAILPTIFSVDTLAPRDRLHLWSRSFDLGKNAVLFLIPPTGLALAFASVFATTPLSYFTTNVISRNRHAALALSSFFILASLPWTRFVIIPKVNVLKKIEADIIKNPEDNNGKFETDTLIQEWGTVHLPRIAFAGTAFVLAVTELVLG